MSLKYRIRIIVTMTILVLGQIITSASFAGTTTYVYDELNRLKEAHFADSNYMES